MSIGEIIPNPSLEQPHYHTLAQEILEKLDDAEALYERGRRLFLGIGIMRDRNTAWELIHRSALQGHPVAIASCYNCGQFTNRDTARACNLFQESALRGHPSGTSFVLTALILRTALSDLGYNHQYGLGVAKDEKEAYRLYSLAAKQHLSTAQSCMGFSYRHGVGVEKNPSEVLRWYRLASSQNYSITLCDLGEFHLRGRYVEKNRLMGACLIRIAASFGNPEAIEQNNLQLSEVLVLISVRISDRAG
jgi:TPR repeat protein